MKKITSTFLLLAIIIFASSFLNIKSNSNKEIVALVKTQFHNGLSDFEKKIKTLMIDAQHLDSSIERIKKLQQSHLENRLAFKKIELFLEYFDRYSIKKMINGAPLLSVEPKVAEVNIIEPSGLQVLDELIFSEQPLNEKERILKNINQLQKDFKKIKSYQQGLNITHRYIFEAARQQIIRVFTLGLTGFDTPGSVNAIPEAIASMESTLSVLLPYFELAKKEDQKFAADFQFRFELAIQYLQENNDFDQFDRMYFTREFIDPIYVDIYTLQKLLNIETIKESNPHTQATNYEAGSIFDQDFLNKNFFSNIDFNQKNIEKKVSLGKLLFYDPILSSNLQRSCASCHQPEKGFTDGLPKSLAIDGKGMIKRNAPTVINAVFAERFFYDLREVQLERQINHVVLDSLEFATNFPTIIKRLSQSDEYKKLFAEAFSDHPKYQLSKWSISESLAAYVTSLSSFNSPVDQYIRKEINDLDPDVIAGFNIFMGKAACGTCHFAPTFNGNVPPIFDESESEILGVPATKDTLHPILDTDPGRAASGRPLDKAPFYVHSFKTVTVRNIAQTAPYMHNGVYDSLEEVVDFYNRGGGLGLGLDVPYQTLPDTPLNLNDQEKAQLVAFMEALTDKSIDTSIPERLPAFENNESWNHRNIGGTY